MLYPAGLAQPGSEATLYDLYEAPCGSTGLVVLVGLDRSLFGVASEIAYVSVVGKRDVGGG